MTESEFAPEQGTEQVRTGIPEVDQVIAAVDALAEQPLEGHAEVFGTAHEQLRRALDVPADGS